MNDRKIVSFTDIFTVFHSSFEWSFSIPQHLPKSTHAISVKWSSSSSTTCEANGLKMFPFWSNSKYWIVHFIFCPFSGQSVQVSCLIFSRKFCSIRDFIQIQIQSVWNKYDFHKRWNELFKREFRSQFLIIINFS